MALRRMAAPVRARPGLAAIACLGIAWGFVMHSMGWAQLAHFAQVRALADGRANIDRWHWQTKDKAWVDGHFYSVKAPRVWYALAGVDVETTPGTYDLRIRAALPGGRMARTVKPVEIGNATFRTGDVNVPENFVKPDQASEKKVAADQRLKKRTFAHFIATAQWSGDFIKPVEAPSTDSFGMTRIFNEELTSEHRGTDFPIKQGSPVVTSNSGTVVLARELFYEGNCVVLDHGQHFFTIYMHLSKIQVREGQKLRKRQRLGLSGATGRVTGPHLHMSVRWEGSYVDPTKLFALTLPETNKVVRTAGTQSVRRRR